MYQIRPDTHILVPILFHLTIPMGPILSIFISGLVLYVNMSETSIASSPGQHKMDAVTSKNDFESILANQTTCYPLKISNLRIYMIYHLI